MYARLLRHLARTPEGATRGRELDRHIIRSLRELAASDLITLRRPVDLDRAFPAKPAPAEPVGGGIVRLLGGEQSKTATENFAKHEQFITSLSPLEGAGLRRLEYGGPVRRADVMGGSQ
jgi:hypothetical protein